MMTSKKPRPADRVLRFLTDELGLHSMSVGARLPTTVELARRLDVSQGTVKNVYRRLADEGKLSIRMGDGTFWQGAPESERHRYTIGLDGDLADSDTTDSAWSYKIKGGLLGETLEAATPIEIRYCKALVEGDENRAARLGQLEGIDGLLLLRLEPHRSEAIIHEGRTIPIISLNPLREDSCRNFVSPDYFTISRKLGSVWRRSGRQRVLMILSPGLESSVSVRLRYGGLLCGLEPGMPGSPEVRYLKVDTGRFDSGYAAMKQFLAQESWRPDAIYTAGDNLAFAALQVLEEAGHRVPEEISIVGGHGADCLSRAPHILTATEHALEKISRAMLRLLMERIDNGGADVPAHIEPSRFILGTTTTPEENRLLFGENPQ